MAEDGTENFLERLKSPRDWFSFDQAQVLADEYQITEIPVKELQFLLCRIAEAYWWNLRYDEPFPKRQDTQKHLDRIRRTARKLAELMESVSPFVPGLVERSLPHDEDGELSAPFDFENTRLSLRVLRERSELAMNEIPFWPKPGESHATGRWADGIKGLFERDLNRKFTVDYEGGEPISEAAQFAVRSLKMIFPEVKSTEIITALRHSQKRPATYPRK